MNLPLAQRSGVPLEENGDGRIGRISNEIKQYFDENDEREKVKKSFLEFVKPRLESGKTQVIFKTNDIIHKNGRKKLSESEKESLRIKRQSLSWLIKYNKDKKNIFDGIEVDVWNKECQKPVYVARLKNRQEEKKVNEQKQFNVQKQTIGQKQLVDF